MPTPRGARGMPVTGRANIDAVASAARQRDREVTAVHKLIADAKRGPQFVTAVEQHLTGLGAQQSERNVASIWVALAESYAAQSNTSAR